MTPDMEPMEYKQSIGHVVPDILISVDDMSLITTPEMTLKIVTADERITLTEKQLMRLMEFVDHLYHRY